LLRNKLSKTATSALLLGDLADETMSAHDENDFSDKRADRGENE
jgi:hypothetical protein